MKVGEGGSWWKLVEVGGCWWMLEEVSGSQQKLVEDTGSQEDSRRCLKLGRPKDKKIGRLRKL